nr:hypothetical protein CFP56_38535 [Quercus suber]
MQEAVGMKFEESRAAAEEELKESIPLDEVISLVKIGLGTQLPPKKGFAHLLRTQATLKAFRTRFNILQDVNIKFCPKGDIDNNRLIRAVFFPLMSILEGGVRFPMDPILL